MWVVKIGDSFIGPFDDEQDAYNYAADSGEKFQVYELEDPDA